MFIGELSVEAGLPKTTVRYYEKEGLLDSPDRNDAGYRIYTSKHLARLEFILKTKRFGFSLEDIKVLLEDGKDGNPPCDRVKKMMKIHLDELNQRIEEMVAFRDVLEDKYHRVKERDEKNPGDYEGICTIIENDAPE